MKPICKGEAHWKFWREDRPWLKGVDAPFTRFAKKCMRRARRRFLKCVKEKD